MNTQGPPSLANAIALLLGRQAAAGGPFALLGLTPDDCTQDLVIVQLQRQLARLAAHPMGNTPAADAVRAALHAAVAELLEALDAPSPTQPSANVPSLTPARSALPLAAPAPRPSPTPHTLPSTVTPELAASARDILAEFGGWNARSRQRLAFLAYSAGVRVDELLRAAQNAAPSPPPAPSPPDHPTPPSPPPSPARPVGVTPDAGLYLRDNGSPQSLPVDDQIDPASRLAKWLILSILGGLAFILVLAVVAYVILKPPATPPPTIAQSTPPSAPTTTTPTPSSELFPAPKPPPAAETPQTKNPPTLSHPREFADDLRDIARAVTTASTDPQAALQSFDAATKSISLSWPSAQPDQLAAMQDAIIEFVYRVAPSPEHAALTIDLLSRGLRHASPPTPLSSDTIRAAPWSAGVLARIARERELPSSISLRLQSTLADSALATWHAGDTSFHAAAAGSLTVLARSLVSPTQASDAWPAWVACVDALRLPQRDRDRMILLAIEDLLTSAPEPTQSKPTFDALSLLVTSLTWRESDESRRYLLRWFDRPNVSVADLHTLTSALASKSSAAGFDVSMILPAGAPDSDRATLRDRLRQAWGLADGPERAKLVSSWQDAATQELDQGPTPTAPGAAPIVELYRAVAFSRLNESAAMLLAGEPGSATIDLVLDASVQTAINTLHQSSSPLTMFNDEPTWLVRYLSAGSNLAAKKSILADLNTSLQLPRAVGEVLVSEVVRGSHPDLRKHAANLARQHAADPAVVHGWLVQLPTMPASQELADLLAGAALAKLPPVRHPSWRVAARRALVERLLQLLADSGDLCGIDHASTLLAQSYAHRLATLSWNSRPDAPRDQPADDALLNVPPLESTARLYRLRLEREAQDKAPTGREPLSLAQIAARHAGRSKIVAGRVQLFAAEQVASLELLAFIVAAERPDASDQIAAILDEATLARRKAPHVATQIEAVERAALRLWRIRLEGAKT